MTKKELLESKAFQDAPDDAEIRVGVFDDYEMMSYWGNLYAVEKTAERTRKETLLEVLNWIEGMYDTDYVAGDIVRMLKDKLKKK